MTNEPLKSRRLVAVFLLGLVLFNFPIISLFNYKLLFFGIPLLFIYMFVSWILIIFLIALITKPHSKRSRSM